MSQYSQDSLSRRTYHDNWIPIQLPRRLSRDCIDWCYEKFGEERILLGTCKGKWLHYGAGKVEFEREEDAVLFALKWA